MSWLASSSEQSQTVARLLETGEMSDVTFKVGTEGRVFRLHKLPLSVYSDTLRNMFTGIEAGGEIELLEDDPEAFYSMVSCIYNNCSNFANNEEACAVLHLSNKYQILSIRKACINYMICNLSIESVVKIYEVATKLQEEKLQSNCWKYITDNKEQVINEDNLTNAKITTLQCFLEEGKFEEGLNLRIYHSVVKWALGECRKQGLEINAKNLHRIIHPLFPNTRLLALTINELLKRIKEEEEKFVFVVNISGKEMSALRCNSTNISTQDDDDKRVIVNNSVFTECKGTKNISITTYFPTITQRLVANHVDIYICGVVFYLSASKTKFVLPESLECILTIRNVTRNVEAKQTVNELDCCFQECFIKTDESYMIKKGEICEIIIEGKYKGSESLYYCNGNCYFYNCYLENERSDSNLTSSFSKPHLHKICLWNIVTI